MVVAVVVQVAMGMVAAKAELVAVAAGMMAKILVVLVISSPFIGLLQKSWFNWT